MIYPLIEFDLIKYWHRGYQILLVDGSLELVNGAMMTFGKTVFMSSGETINAGRGYLISVPTVGSKLTQYTSPHFTIAIHHQNHQTLS